MISWTLRRRRRESNGETGQPSIAASCRPWSVSSRGPITRMLLYGKILHVGWTSRRPECRCGFRTEEPSSAGMSEPCWPIKTLLSSSPTQETWLPWNNPLYLVLLPDPPIISPGGQPLRTDLRPSQDVVYTRGFITDSNGRHWKAPWLLILPHVPTIALRRVSTWPTALPTWDWRPRNIVYRGTRCQQSTEEKNN